MDDIPLPFVAKQSQRNIQKFQNDPRDQKLFLIVAITRQSPIVRMSEGSSARSSQTAVSLRRSYQMFLSVILIRQKSFRSSGLHKMWWLSSETNPNLDVYSRICDDWPEIERYWTLQRRKRKRKKSPLKVDCKRKIPDRRRNPQVAGP